MRVIWKPVGETAPPWTLFPSGSLRQHEAVDLCNRLSTMHIASRVHNLEAEEGILAEAYPPGWKGDRHRNDDDSRERLAVET